MSAFNLEQAIQNRRQKLEKHQEPEPGYIEEMASHLRDKIDDLIQQEKSEDNAFRLAVGNRFENAEGIADQVHSDKDRIYCNDMSASLFFGPFKSRGFGLS